MRRRRLISQLQQEFAWTYSAPGPQLGGQVKRCAQLLVLLYDAGAKVDSEMTNRLVLSGRGVEPGFDMFGAELLTQDQYDEWQREQVERRDREGMEMTPPGGWEPGWWKR